jgi:hypothetical protein
MPGQPWSWDVGAAVRELEDYLSGLAARPDGPEGYVPMTLEQNRVFVAFNDWLRGLRFAPGRLKKTAMLDEAQPMYVPVWLASGTAHASYRGQRGTDRKEQEESTDAAGNTQLREVSRTDWEPVSGYVQHPFEDVVVCGWSGVPDAHAHVLKPRGGAVKPWTGGTGGSGGSGGTASDLGSHTAQPCEVDARAAFGKAQATVEGTVRGLVERDIGGNHQRIESLQTYHGGVSLRQVLVPVYRGKYRFRNKDYWVTVNGATGEAAGDYPVSKTKVLMTVLLGIAAVAAIVLGIVFLVLKFKK